MIDPFLQELAKEVTVFQMALDQVVKEHLARQSSALLTAESLEESTRASARWPV